MRTDATPEERQEALSVRYVQAARVVKLESGRFAVFTMASGHILATVDKDDLPGAIEEACQLSLESWQKAKRETAERMNVKEPIKLAVSFDDLGL